MKKIGFFIISMLFFIATVSCKKESSDSTKNETTVTNVSSESTKKSSNGNQDYPEFTFTENEYDFGTINQGDKVSHDFTFTNTGKADLKIKEARGSCGCTVPEYPKSSIKPGEKGIIKVSFNSTGKSGINTKSVILTSNCKQTTKILIIKANIIAPKKN
jgi:hypothetical protein